MAKTPKTPKQKFYEFVLEQGLMVYRHGNRMTAMPEVGDPILLWDDEKAPDWEGCLLNLRSLLSLRVQDAAND